MVTLRSRSTVVLGVLLVLSIGVGAEEPASWYKAYEEGIRLLQQGKAAGARASLELALELRSTEGLRIATTPGRYLDYVPHVYLSVAAHMTGDVAEARRQLRLAEQSGIALESEAGRSLLESMRHLLGEEQAVAIPAREGYREFERKPVVLSSDEFEVLRRNVANRCGLPSETSVSLSPWYFHYELGLELARRGDPQRALDSLLEATERRPEPRRQARMYGMWFIDYTPYFQIAKVHAELQNYACARDAMEISERLGELRPDSPLYSEWQELSRFFDRQ
ncbi:MAG TPA: hypothetical protein VM534_08650 [Thermoanaerobaculia bacterium]|nr:hypothetical protein [Thermoanaerobaculia bacterium]